MNSGAWRKRTTVCRAQGRANQNEVEAWVGVRTGVQEWGEALRGSSCLVGLGP